MHSPLEENGITPVLIARYVSGKATLDEWIGVIAAIEDNPSLGRIVERYREIHEGIMKLMPCPNPQSEPVCAFMRLRPRDILPAASRAAVSEFNDCVVDCEHYVLGQRGRASEYRKLYKTAVANNWLKTGDGKAGTPLYNIGRLSELASLSVARIFKGTLEVLRKELDAGCSVIAAVSAGRLKGKRSKECDHAVVVLAVSEEEDYVEIHDPARRGDGTADAAVRYPIKTFLDAWKASRNFFVSVIERGARPYTPHPEDVSGVRLPKDVLALEDMLAENAHEIWAASRIVSRSLTSFFRERPGESFGREELLSALGFGGGAWRSLAEETLDDMVGNGALKRAGEGSYRLKRGGRPPKANVEEDVADDPYMKPFLDLAMKDRKTDYLTTVNALKLLYKMGYRLTREEDVGIDFRPNRLTADGRYVPSPVMLDDVELPGEIKELTEYIAENAHEEWARRRLNENWVFSPKTNRKRKQSFDLVPYCELLDSEKKYDRRMAMNTVRLLYKMGYRLVNARKNKKNSK